MKRGSNSTVYLLARLDRDRPDLAQRARAGELRIKEAAIQAGVVRERTPFDDMRCAWTKASVGERVAFLSWLRRPAVRS